MSEVFVMRGGSSRSYHTDKDCRYIQTANSNRERQCGYANNETTTRTIPLEQAELRGLEPCSACGVDHD